MLLNPRSSLEAECRKLKLNLDAAEPTKYFTCNNCRSSTKYSDISLYYDTTRCRCGEIMYREMEITSEQENGHADDSGGFAKQTVPFLIADNLKMVPNIAGSIFQTLSRLGVVDTDEAEQRTVKIGFNEIMDLLKGSLLSNTTLTDLILGKRKMNPTAVKLEPAHHSKQEESSNSRKMISKVIVQKSTNKFLFAQAEDDFVEFLFSFPTISLAGVEWLLGCNSSLRNIDNLYRSAADLTKYLKIEGPGKSLYKPWLPPMYLSDNQLFSLEEHEAPKLYYSKNFVQETECLLYKMTDRSSTKRAVVNDPKGKGTCVKGPGMYVVRDDLTVTPLLMSSTLATLKGIKIQLSDVEELEIHIGQEEGLRILKSSLTSTCALSNALSFVVQKQSWQEPIKKKPKHEPGV